MSRIDWTQVGNRFFEAGVDRGVLYVGDNAGIPWTGLTEVTESPTIGDTQQYYYDGVNYLNVAGVEEFKATINALYSPEEFDECDGSLYLSRGFKARGQRRKTFGICYRTKIGNDTQGEDYSYKIHLVYNALAAPAEHTHTSIGEDKEAATLAWDLVTKPVRNAGMAPSAHFVIDASQMHPLHLGLIEDILYGDDENDPRMLTPTEVLDLLETNYEFVQNVNIYPDPSHEYGIAPFPSVATAGTGTMDTDTSIFHSGTQSLRFKNTAPRTIARQNLWTHPFWAGSDAPTTNSANQNWICYGLGGTTYTLGPGDVYKGRTSVRFTNTLTELLTGQDFETDLGGWGGSGTTAVRDQTHVHSGAWSMKLNERATANGFQTTLVVPSIVSGSTYVFSVWMYIPSGVIVDSNCRVVVTGAPFTLTTSYPDSTKVNQWQQVTVTAVATANGSAAIYLYPITASTPAPLWVDDISFAASTAGNTRLSIRNNTTGGSNPSIPAGTDFWVSADIYLSSNAQTAAVLNASIIARDDPNNDSTAATFDPVMKQTTVVKGGWAKVWWRATVNSGRTITSLYFTGATAGAGQVQPNNAYMQLDNILVTPVVSGESSPPAYFDGDLPMDVDGTYDYVWSGTQYESVSQQMRQGNSTAYSVGSLGSPEDYGIANGDNLTVSVWANIKTGFTPYSTHSIELYGTAFAVDRILVAYPSTRDEWDRISLTYPVLDATGTMYIRIYGGTQSDDVVNFDDFMINKGVSPADDFNGDTPATPQDPVGNLAYRWEGVPGQSPSDEFMQFGVVEVVNVYPDPSHEYGLTPFNEAFDSGSGTVELDTTDSHTGTQSVKMTNVTPSQVLLENIFPDPGAEYGLNGWHAYVDGSVTQDYSQVRTGSSSLKTTSVTQPATAHMDTALEDSNGNSILARNTQYTVIVWGRVDASAPNQWQIRYNTGAGTATQDSPLSTTPKGNWGRLSFTFTTQASGLDGLYIRTPAAPANVWIDDMSLIQGPLPVLDAVDFVQANNFPTDAANQGIAYDGTYYYTVVSQTIRKYSRDWILQASRDVSNDILSASTNHVSAPYVLNGQIIIPIHNDPNPAIIGRWNASDLSFVSATMVTGGVDTASAALSYDPVTNEFLIPGYYSGENNLERFDANFNYLGSIASPVNFPQGILVYEDRYYIHGDWPGGVTTDNPNGRGLISIKKDGTDPRMIVPEPIQELEGICVGEDSTFVLLGNVAGQLTINQYKILGSGFNGDTPSNAEGIGYVWVGAPGASHSRRIKLGQGTGYSSLALGTLASMGFQNGDPITWSAWVKIPTGSTPDIYVLQLGPANDAVTTAAAVPPPDDRDTWVKVSGSTTVQDATKAPLFWVYAATKTGDVIRYDDFAIEKVDADTGTTDFNGDTLSTPYTSDGRYNFHWVGDPGVSPSEMILSQI